MTTTTTMTTMMTTTPISPKEGRPAAKSRNFLAWRIGRSLATAATFCLTYIGISPGDPDGLVLAPGAPGPGAAQAVFAAGPQIGPRVWERQDGQPGVRVVVLPKPKARARAS